VRKGAGDYPASRGQMKWEYPTANKECPISKEVGGIAVLGFYRFSFLVALFGVSLVRLDIPCWILDVLIVRLAQRVSILQPKVGETILVGSLTWLNPFRSVLSPIFRHSWPS
jgi:hypothetical protein